MILIKLIKYCLFLFIIVFLTGCSSQFIDLGCESYSPKKLKINDSHEFVVWAVNKCNPSGIYFDTGQYYKFEVKVESRIEDGRIKYNPQYPKKNEPLGPDGFSSKNLKLYERIFLAIGQPFRPIPSSKANWFELVGTIDKRNDNFFSVHYYAQNNLPYQAYTIGELFCLVNDFPLKYSNNRGSFKVKVTHVPATNK